MSGLLHGVLTGHDPARTAIRFRGTDVSYGDLDRRSSRLAQALRGHGIGPGHIVGLLLDRGLRLPVAELAVMKAGAAWTMLDPQLPPARLAYQTGDAGARLVLTTADLAPLAPDGTPRWLLDRPDWFPGGGAPEAEIRPEDPAYLLYTSGSTGTPKGILVAHRSAYAYCRNAVAQFAATPDDRVAQVSNPAFDASIFDYYATWLAGATLVSAPREVIADPEALTALLRDERITLAYLPPALLALLDPARLAGTALRGAFSAGEALPVTQANRWRQAGLALHNSYGPTETTVVVTDYLCPDTPLRGTTPIGTAMPGHRAYVLDRRLRPAPIGIPGELHIAGTGVAYGYHHRPDLTARSFLADPYGPAGARMYATGDLARWRTDGTLEYLGRRDRQIQLRGQRVELGEIEHTVAQHPGVRQCTVQVHHETHLVAYLTGDPDVDDLRRHLADRLPTYMIPTSFVTLPELPITPNGKLDTDRLPAPAPAAAEHVPPRTGTEQWLAAAWQNLLDAGDIGATDNFFDLGGNSLHVTQLIARIRDEAGVALHPHALFTDPTLERLAALVDRTGDADTGARAGSGVVTLHRATGRPPLFLVHPSGGSVTAYARLAGLLGDDQPVHAVEDPALHHAEPAGDLATRAREYGELIRRTRPHGSCHLGGWSLGGVVALEMARQLTDAGHPVGTVVLIDPGAPDRRRPPDDVAALSWFAHDLAGQAGTAPPTLDPDTFRGLARDARDEAALDVLDRAGLVPAGLRDEIRLRMRAFATNVRALRSHRPRRYDGPVTLIRTEADAEDDDTIWKELCARLDRRTVPGNHYTMLQPPHLDALATTVREALAA